MKKTLDPRPRCRYSVLALMTLTLASVACHDPLAPFEPEIGNDPDSFQLQATDVTNATATLQFEWVNSGVVANVDHSTATTRGTARLTVRDPTGAILYDATLRPSLNEQTQVGVAGLWMVTLRLTDYSGTLNFRLQKP